MAKHVTPHSNRHTTPTLLRAGAGVDINTIRAWLGHVPLDTTNVYAEIDFETKARALAKCEAAATGAARLHWRDRPALMDSLRSLWPFCYAVVKNRYLAWAATFGAEQGLLD